MLTTHRCPRRGNMRIQTLGCDSEATLWPPPLPVPAAVLLLLPLRPCTRSAVLAPFCTLPAVPRLSLATPQTPACPRPPLRPLPPPPGRRARAAGDAAGRRRRHLPQPGTAARPAGHGARRCASYCYVPTCMCCSANHPASLATRLQVRPRRFRSSCPLPSCPCACLCWPPRHAAGPWRPSSTPVTGARAVFKKAHPLRAPSPPPHTLL